MKECNCDLRTKLVGDGCAVCNPEQALEHALGTIEDLKQERDELAAQVDEIFQIVEGIKSNAGTPEFVYQAAKHALSITPSAALREVEARTLEHASDHERLYCVRDYLRAMAAAIRKGE